MHLHTYLLRRRLLGALALIAFTFSGYADEALTLTSTQIRALRLVKQRISENRDGGGAFLPAKVVVPTSQMRIIAAPVTGVIELLASPPGTAVRLGETLARIASPEALSLQREAQQAASQSALLRENLRRDEALFKEGLIAEGRLQSIRSAASQATAQASERRLGLEMAGVAPGRIGGPLNLVAPIDGVILEQGVQLGQRIEASAMIYRIARLSPLWIEAQLPASRIGEVRIGQRLQIAGSAIEGQVITIGRAVDQVSQSVLLRAVVDRDAGQMIVGQMVEVVLAGSDRRGFSIPGSAIVRHQGKTVVFVEQESSHEGSRYVARPIVIVNQGSDSAVVTGLKFDDSIVTSGASSLKAILAGVGKS